VRPHGERVHAVLLGGVDHLVTTHACPGGYVVDRGRVVAHGSIDELLGESAVRLRHLPSGIVVACQSERSQHKNRSTAMKMLKAKLYELEVNKRNAAAKVLEDAKSDVSWGNQIRSYVLDQSRIKDLRTGVEIGNTTSVLDGDLNAFLEASLKQGL